MKNRWQGSLTSWEIEVREANGGATAEDWGIKGGYLSLHWVVSLCLPQLLTSSSPPHPSARVLSFKSKQNARPPCTVHKFNRTLLRREAVACGARRGHTRTLAFISVAGFGGDGSENVKSGWGSRWMSLLVCLHKMWNSFKPFKKKNLSYLKKKKNKQGTVLSNFYKVVRCELMRLPKGNRFNVRSSLEQQQPPRRETMSGNWHIFRISSGSKQFN